ncbi:MAG: DUF3795 domain-containing protein [Solobacterium sp.]|nr:DUF3795 domain-containing protein [Solobacterium sp.]
MDEILLGKCGYYCGQCPDYIAGRCSGCIKGNKKGDCFSRDCVIEKGILSCGYCQEFPCEKIQKDPKATLLSPLWLKWKATRKDI